MKRYYQKSEKTTYRIEESIYKSGIYKSLLSRMHKEHLNWKQQQKKAKNPVKQYLNKYFSREDIQIANKPMKDIQYNWLLRKF